jgi:hypothetical protein
MFFEHAGDAVAVDLATHDVTDVFSASQVDASAAWTAPTNVEAERRATLIARSALASQVNSLRTFAVPEVVRASARQARDWQRIYGHDIELPLLAAGGLVPPHPVREAAHGSLDVGLTPDDRARALQLSSDQPIDARLVQQMGLFFSRHTKDRVDPQVWASWGGDAGKVWATKIHDAATSDANTLSEILAESETIDYDALRLLPRAFSMINGPHTSECDGNGSCSCGGSKSSARYPSTRALTYLALGGDSGRNWAARTLARAETEALTAAGYDPDAGLEVATSEEEETADQDGQDGTVPHVFFPVVEFPAACIYCGQGERDELHDPSAVDYYLDAIDPADAHHFTEQVDNADLCAVCSKSVEDTRHQQAALAAYYLHKTQFDQMITETNQHRADQGQTAGGAEGEAPAAVTSAAEQAGVDWIEVPRDAVFERAAQVDERLDSLFWARRGSEEEDPLTYYAAYTGNDPMILDQLYVSDGSMFYQYEPRTMTWEQTSLGTPLQVYELDDETALVALRALSVFPDEPVDLREVDPGEAMMMEGAGPLLDDGMADRVVVIHASGAVFGDYTPEERAANAKQQVRDAGGRFAKSGAKIAVGPEARTGTVTKIHPDTQEIEVKFDDDGSTANVPAKSTRITAAPPAGENPVIDVSKIEGKPRATGRTPKATLPMMLPPMDAEAINAVVENYPNFIAKERAGAAARKKAQDANDDASRKNAKAEQDKILADYQRRLESIHSKGKSARDAIDRAYRKILPKKWRAGVEAYHRAAALLAAGTPITDPAQSDVAPVYMAEVDEANQQNVLELLAMVPASSEGTDAQVLRYTATGWISDPKILRQLKSTAPPAIVSLDEATFNDTLAQVKKFYTTPQGKAEAEAEAKEAASPVAASTLPIYGEYGELLAAGIPGIADTPSDAEATEKLKRYWKYGRGGTEKVRWNTPGDMTRCMRHLKKYMPKPGMSEGYCAKLHHEMTGEWPGDRRNVGRRGSAGASGLLDTTLLSSGEVIAFSATVAAANALCAGVEAPASVADVPTELTGAPFVIPVLAPVGVKSGDGRHFAPLSLSTRELPLPLMWQIQTAEGHDASVIVGRIDSIDRDENGSLVNARGVFDVGPYGQEAERLVRHKFLRGVSVDLDNFEAEARNADTLVEREKNAKNETEVVRIMADDMTVTNGRVMGATLVAKPAFQEVTIELAEDQMEEEAMVADGTYIGTPESETETQEMIRSALTAAGIPISPPKEWFTDPGLTTETPLTVDDDGRVYGHIATWDTDHVGLPFSTRPPRSRSNYAYFHTGLLRTAEGSDVPVGQITLAGGHAPLNADAAMAVKHYDDTASAFCDVHAGEDAYGIWVAGALRPDVTASQVRAVRAAAPSGDWRPIHGRLEMVAVCQVNVPGFPVTRAMVSSGHVYALVAAGTQVLNRMRADAGMPHLDALIERVDALEAPQREALEAAREAALLRMQPVLSEHNAALAAAREAAVIRFTNIRSPEAAAVRDRVATLMQDGDAYFRDVSPDKRKELAKKGAAMPDGSYPISSVGDLKNAIRAYGRAKDSDKPKVRRHIKKRARALGKTDVIPESWASLTTPVQDVAGEITDLMQRMALIAGGAAIPSILSASDETLDGIALVAVGHYPNGEPWDPGNHPRDEKGKFRQVIAELRSDLEGEAGTARAVEGLDEAQQAADSGDTDAAQQAAKDVLTLVDKLAENTEDKGLVQTLRDGYTSLADAVANLPLAFGNLNEKYRYSDLPPDLKGLIDDLVKRADQLVDPEHQDEASGKLKEFMAGGDQLSQPQLSAELSKILRFMI